MATKTYGVFGFVQGNIMKVIGFSEGSVGREGNIEGMVKNIVEKGGHEIEFVKLKDLTCS